MLRVTPNGPAAKAGLKAGDKIVKVGGVEAKDLASLYLMKLIEKSAPGTVVPLTGSNGRTSDVVLTSNAAMLKALRPKP